MKSGIVDNRTGAGGGVAMEIVAQSAADGVDVVAPNSPAEFTEKFVSEVGKIRKLLKKTGIQL